MPTQTKEYSLYAPGKLVKSLTNIYSSQPIAAEIFIDHIKAGTVGMILSGPKPNQGFSEHYQVQFLKNVVWWVRHNEIEPYFD